MKRSRSKNVSRLLRELKVRFFLKNESRAVHVAAELAFPVGSDMGQGWY